MSYQIVTCVPLELLYYLMIFLDLQTNWSAPQSIASNYHTLFDTEPEILNMSYTNTTTDIAQIK